MRITRKIPALTMAVSLTVVLLASASSAVAKSGHNDSKQTAHSNSGNSIQMSRKGDHDGDRKRKEKQKDKEKGWHKGTNKCGGKEKCPTPKPVRIIHDGPPVSPPVHSPPSTGNSGGAILSDPGYNKPSAGNSSGGGGAGSPNAGPARDGGPTQKQN